MASGNWEILYTVTVTNTGANGTTYTLSDVPTPASGWTQVSGAFITTVSTPTLPSANTPIEAGGSDSFTYRLEVTRNANVENPVLVCNGTTDGAFFNRATVTFPGGTATDTGCATPASPTIEKKGNPSVAKADGTWTISYDIEVKNTSTKTLVYTLTDPKPANPAGTTIDGWTVTGPGGAAIPGWPASSTIASGVSLAPGATHIYKVIATLAFNPGESVTLTDCNGEDSVVAVVNSATVSNGLAPASSEDCVSVVPPKVTVEKSDASLLQNADGDWILAYDVTVTNAGTTAAPYSLTDTPNFGGNFEVVPGSGYWTAKGSSTQLPGNPSGVLAAAPASVTWTYHVTATVGEEGFDPATGLRCTTEGSEPGGGFYNVATVSFPGGTDSDAGCGVPQSPTVTRSRQSARRHGTARTGSSATPCR